jgi:hypothetical protein
MHTYAMKYPIEPFLINFDDVEKANDIPRHRDFKNITWGEKTCCENLNQAYALLALVRSYLSNRLDTKATYTVGINLQARLINKQEKYYLEISCDDDLCQIDKLRATGLDLQLSRLLGTMVMEISDFDE